MSTTTYEDIEITWLGHASFRLRGVGKVVYIDPYVLDDEPPMADIVLATHEHYDHCPYDNIMRILKEDGVVITTKKCASSLGIQCRTVRAGDVVEVDGVRVEAVPAYNIDKPFHPKGLGVGFVVEMGGVRIYHAGDTDLIPEMENVRTDVALLPIGGTYTMNPTEAVEAACKIGPKVVIPMHYNYLSGLEQDAHSFALQLKKRAPEIEVRILE